MRSDESASAKLKRVYTDFPNIILLTKSATPSDIQITFGHAFLQKKSLRESVATLALAGSLESLTVVFINT